MNEGILTAEVFSFTKQVTNTVSIAKYLSEKDRVLIVDDFLANGQTAKGLVEIVEQAGAKVEAVGIVIEIFPRWKTVIRRSRNSSLFSCASRTV